MGFWMVDTCWEGRSQRSAPQKIHTAHLRRHTHCTPRKLSGWNGGGHKTCPPPGSDCTRQAPGHLSCSDLGKAQNAGPTHLRLRGVPENLNLSGLDLGSALNPGPTSDSSRQSILEPEKYRPYESCEQGANPVRLKHCEHSPHTPVIFVCSVLPSPQQD